MKVLLINKFHYLRGGAESVYFNTKKVLEEKGHTVICFSMQDERNEPCQQDKFFVKNVDFENNGKWFSKALRYLYYPQAKSKLEQLIIEEEPDIAHLHNISHHLTNSILKPLNKHKIPIVQTLHDYQWIAPNYSLFSNGQIDEACFKHKYYNCISHKSIRNSFWPSVLAAVELYLYWIFKPYRKIQLFVSPSDFLKKKYIDYGFPPIIKVIPNFLNYNNFKPEYNPGDYFIYVGRLSDEKGLMTLLQAIKRNPELKLKIVGGGPKESDLKRYIELNRIENVEMLGPKYGFELFDLIKYSKAMVVPSEWYENYPMVVIEAMALGKPVVASDLGGLSEMIDHEVTGWLVPASNVDALKHVLVKVNKLPPEQLIRAGRAARVKIEHTNSSDKYYESLMRAYQGVLPKYKLNLG